MEKDLEVAVNVAVSVPVVRGNLADLPLDRSCPVSPSPSLAAAHTPNRSSQPPSSIVTRLDGVLDDDDDDDDDHNDQSVECHEDDETQCLKIKVIADNTGSTNGDGDGDGANPKREHLDYHTDDDMVSIKGEHSRNDTMDRPWIRMGAAELSQTGQSMGDSRTSTVGRFHSSETIRDWTSVAGTDLDEQWQEYIMHLRHLASYKAEFDIYQVLAYRAKVSYGQKIYMKPFKSLKGCVSDKWANFEVRWLNSFQRVLCQALICSAIQTLGVTTVIVAQFMAYFNDKGEYAQCDSSPARWKEDWYLKLLAFLWTSFISLGVSGWIYRARHSGFYPILLFMKRDAMPPFVSVTWLQIGLLINYYVVTSSVIGSFILIYQTEGGTETIGMILQAVALFFVLELDNKIVHARDFASIRKYFDMYIKHGKHKKFQAVAIDEEDVDRNCLQRPCCGNKQQSSSCLGGTLSVTTFILLIIMTFGAMIAPWIIMVCW